MLLISFLTTGKRLSKYHSNSRGQTVSYYSYAGGFWAGYDDSVTIDWKAQFARSRGLGGYFFWALGQDKDWIISKQGKDA
ncbi:hypothetical protein D5086_013971 [Populus alba]|uniref:Uncharacterized protein n=1 Tax=Populus alba TaxID=43335 RepID=A0ACC4C6I0_POPAL